MEDVGSVVPQAAKRRLARIVVLLLARSQQGMRAQLVEYQKPRQVK
jgi:hypothetical protein